jgi:hypothetical protein
MTTDPNTTWIDGHPQLEAIAAAVWEKCERSDSGLVVDDPRNIAVAVLAAVLPPPADRAAVYREAADVAERLMDERYGPDCSYGVGGRDVARELRRLADEAQQQPAECRCTCSHPADVHSVYGCEDDCGCEWMPKPKPMNPWRILGIADCPTPKSHNWGCGCPTDQLPLHAESGVDTPGCDCGHDGMGPKWHAKACAWTATLNVPHPDTGGGDCCGAEPTDKGWIGDCWCTLPPGHDGEHQCQPCTDRHGAPGWTDEPAATARQDGAQQ